MEFSFGEPKSSSSEALASDRLRKAIERNRAKQAKRSGATASASSSSTSSRAWTPPGSNRSTTLRRGVATNTEDAEFTTDIKSRPRSRVRATSEYLPTKTTRKKRAVKRKKQTDKDFIHYLVVGGWLFCALLMLRLTFSNGGIIDYYSNTNRLEARHNQYASIVQENEDLKLEIHLIRESSSHQRQLVRDHLGYIASDEYLIVFPRSHRGPAI